LRLRYIIKQMDVNFLGVYPITVAAFYKVLVSLRIVLKEY